MSNRLKIQKENNAMCGDGKRHHTSFLHPHEVAHNIIAHKNAFPSQFQITVAISFGNLKQTV